MPFALTAAVLVLRLASAALAILAAFVCGGGCGGADEKSASGAPCTRTRDCAEGVCCAGTCAPVDVCDRDAGPDAGDGGDAGAGEDE